jgi:hypothetical protein
MFVSDNDLNKSELGKFVAALGKCDQMIQDFSDD